MQFTLHYQGALPPNGDGVAKHEIRKQLHPQLQDLWTNPRLEYARPRVLDPSRAGQKGHDVVSNLHTVGGFLFASVVSRGLHVAARLRIDFLRPESPGRILQSGDIDNRIKTLFDGLSVPQQPNMLPKSFVQTDESKPMHCLLEDDSLVTGLEVQTYRWLGAAGRQANEVLLVIHVTTSLVGSMNALNEGLS